MNVILSNDCAIDSEGWALIAPFGEHPKTRVIRGRDGHALTQRFIQILDQAAADALLSKENSILGRLKRAVIGIPVFKGHPDLREHAPDTLAAKGEKRGIGVVDKVRKGAAGIEAHFVLTPEGAQAVQVEGAKYPSALWLVEPIGERDGAILARPFKLLSVGLTAHPNIFGVDSLANARGTLEEKKTSEPEMKLITGWLLGHGISLANADSATETQVLEALDRFVAAEAGKTAALGNEKTTLAGQYAALETQRQIERQGRAQAVVDLAIHQGRLAVSERSGRIAALENSEQFEADAKVLLEAAPVVRMRSDTQAGKILANDLPGSDVRKAHLAAIEKHMEDTGETDFMKAHQAVLAKNPALAEALTPKA